MSDKCSNCGAWTEEAAEEYGHFDDGSEIDDVCECDAEEGAQ